MQIYSPDQTCLSDYIDSVFLPYSITGIQLQRKLNRDSVKNSWSKYLAVLAEGRVLYNYKLQNAFYIAIIANSRGFANLGIRMNVRFLDM